MSPSYQRNINLNTERNMKSFLLIGFQFKKAYERILGDIDPLTNVGPDSSDQIAGGSHTAAPQSLKLRNGKVMVKRSRGADAVPRLLYSGALSRYSNTLLFTPWRQLESIQVDQDNIETVEQRRTKLELFPLGVFKICLEEPDGDSDDVLE